MGRDTRPGFPPGAWHELEGRGRLFARHRPAAPGAPTVLLLHGLAANADLNWRTALPSLEDGWGVVMADHRGHCDGLRSAFELRQCAEDAATLLDKLGVGPVIAVGYSMGGPIAMLLARIRPDLVSGLVFAATAARFVGTLRERLLLGAADMGRHLPTALLGPAARVAFAFPTKVVPGWEWAPGDLERHHWPTVIEAARAVLRFDATGWVHELAAVPSVCVITTDDGTVPPRRQHRLAAAVAAERVFLHGDHSAPARRPNAFGRAIADAVRLLAAEPAETRPDDTSGDGSAPTAA